MSTALDLITLCLKDIGTIAAGQAPTANEASDALLMLNNMIDRWSTNGLLLFNDGIEKFLLTSGKQSYTMGPGGDFDTVRPTQITNAGLEVQSFTPTYELPVDIVNLDTWSGLIIKSVQSNIPTAIYVNEGFPFSTINVWPVPSDANKLVLYSEKPLTSIATLSTVISLPPGYFEALQYNLDVRLAPHYGRALRAEYATMAQESLADIKRANTGPYYLGTDAALHSRRTRFNWLIGE